MGKLKTALVSEILPVKMEKRLREYGVDILRLPPSQKVVSEVRTHPDMLCCKTPEGILFCDPSQGEILSPFIECRIGREINRGYKQEVLYNCFFTKDYLFCSKYSDESIVEYAKEMGYKIVFVKQGYVKCSVAICSGEDYITADIGIYNALKSCGYNVLLIKGDDIGLEGYSNGFIGGCCGLIGENKLAFTGSLEKMESGEEIINFLDKIGVESLILSDDRLYDYGGIILL